MSAVTEQWQDVLLRLRVERETSPWWTRNAHWTPEDDAPASIWDDSEVTTARRRRDLRRATAHRITREDTA